LDHVLRIDRIFRQPQGHLLLIGVSGAGKTTLSRFVAFMNGLSVFQIRVNIFYTNIAYRRNLYNLPKKKLLYKCIEIMFRVVFKYNMI